MMENNIHYHKMYDPCYDDCPLPHYTKDEAEDRYDQWLQEWALELGLDIDG